MATTYFPPTVKQFVDGAMVAFYDASATSAIEADFESSTQTANSPVTNDTIASLGAAFSTSPIVTGNITADLNKAATNLTGGPITVSGELNAFLGLYNLALADGFTTANAEGLTIASFAASTLGAVAGNLGLTPSDLAAFQTQQQAAINRANVSGFYADSATPGSTLVPVTVGDAAWVASQNALLGVTSDTSTVAAQDAKITAAEAVTPNNPALITPLPAPGQTFTLTTGVDTVPPAGTTLGDNNTVNGIGGGPTGAAVGSTFTPNDSINFGTTTGNVFNLQGIGPAGTWNVTSVPGAHVSGIQTVNIDSNTLFGALSSQSVTGNFTATGPEGDWTGLTLLAVSSGSGILGGVDNLTVDPTTAVQVTDSLLGPTATPMTINGGSTVTITENNILGFGNAGITVNGGTGTTSVSITQTEIPFSATDGVVLIQDAGFAAKAAGTITTVVLDGLDTFNTAGSFPVGPPDASWVYAATINDNALANLTINDVTAFSGTSVLITDNLATPTATTLNLSLNNDGNFAPSGFGGVTIVDANNEITTVHLTLGNQASTLTLWDNGLTSVDIPIPATGSVGTGVFNAEFDDNVANAVTFNFSNSNAADDIVVNRGASGNQNDVYSIGNGGTPLTNQFLTITNNGNLVNTDTINFGSGTNVITDVAHNGGVNSIHNYVNTVANGAFLNLATADTVQSWTSIANTALFGHDTLLFQQDPVNTVINTGPAASVSAGLLNGLLTFAPHEAGSFHFGGNTYVFDHADASTAFTAHDSLVEIAGNAVATLGTVNTSHVITLLA